MAAAGPSSARQDSSGFYLDELSDIAFEKVTRYMSAQPNAKDWTKYIREKDLAVLYKDGGEFGRFVRQRFDSVCISNCFGVRVPGKTDNWVYVRNINLVFQILMRGGHNIKAILIEDSSFVKFKHAQKLSAIALNCTSIQSMIVPGDIPARWFELFGSRIKTLKLHYRYYEDLNDFRPISRHCANLRELSVLNLIDGELAAANLWSKIASTLEVLTITCASSEEIRDIQKHCRKLTTVDIRSNSNCDTLSRFFASYKGQLTSLCTYDMPPDRLKYVVDNCPNARFSLETSTWQSPDYCRIVGKQVEKVFFAGMETVSVDDQSGWDSCPDIEDICIAFPMGIDHIEGILNQPKLYLKSFTLHVDHDGANIPESDFKATIKALSAGALTSLESFTCNCPFPDADTFDSFVNMNKSLRKVIIFANLSQELDYEVIRDRVIDLVKCFFKAPKLKYLKIGIPDFLFPRKERAIANLINGMFRFRRIKVVLDADEYS